MLERASSEPEKHSSSGWGATHITRGPCFKKSSTGTGSGEPSGLIGVTAQEDNDGNAAAAAVSLRKSLRSMVEV
jgi:hypothetical protein